MAIKRMNYFKGEFLKTADFQTEQEYHLGMLRRHNRTLHTWGIAEGLDVTFVQGDKKVTVTPGTAIDSDGKTIVIQESKGIDLSSTSGNEAYITIRYDEAPTDKRSDAGVEGDSRWTEEPLLASPIMAPADVSKELILAKVILDAQKTVQKIILDDRNGVGAVVKDLAVDSLSFKVDATTDYWPKMVASFTNQKDNMMSMGAATYTSSQKNSLEIKADNTSLSGSLTVAGTSSLGGSLNVTGTISGTGAAYVGTDLTVSGSGTVSKTLTVQTDLNVLNNTSVSKALSVGTDLTVNGNGTITKALTIKTDLNVSNNASITKAISVGTDLGVANNATITKALSVGTDLNVSNNASITKALSVGTDLGVANNATITKTLNVGTDLNVSNNASITKALSVGTDLGVANNATITKAINVGTDLRVGSNGSTLNVPATGDLAFRTNKFVVKSTGEVGIGTASPQGAVQIATGSDASLAATSGYLVIGQTTAENMVVDNNEILARNNGLVSPLYFQNEGGDLAIHDNLTEDRRIVFKDNGSVGVGFAAPREKLDVNGKILCLNERKEAVATNQISTTSTTWVDMSNMSLSITTSGYSNVLILFKIGGVQTSTTATSQNIRGKFQLLVDGSQVAYTLHEFHNGGWELRDVTLMDIAVLSRGTHTIKVQWCTESGTLWGSYWGDHRKLIAVEL